MAMKHVFWLQRIRRDGIEQVQPRRVTIERAIKSAREQKKFKSDQDALDWFVKEKKGRLVK